MEIGRDIIIRNMYKVKDEINKIEVFILSDKNQDLSDGEMLDEVLKRLAKLKSSIKSKR